MDHFISKAGNKIPLGTSLGEGPNRKNKRAQQFQKRRSSKPLKRPEMEAQRLKDIRKRKELAANK